MPSSSDSDSSIGWAVVRVSTLVCRPPVRSPSIDRGRSTLEVGAGCHLVSASSIALWHVGLELILRQLRNLPPMRLPFLAQLIRPTSTRHHQSTRSQRA